LARANGIILYGNKGTIDYDGSATYKVYDLDNNSVKTLGEDPLRKVNLANSADPGLNDNHALNFVEAIRGNAQLSAPIDQGHISTLLAQLGNIAQRVGHELQIAEKNRHIFGDRKAARLRAGLEAHGLDGGSMAELAKSKSELPTEK